MFKHNTGHQHVDKTALKWKDPAKGLKSIEK